MLDPVTEAWFENLERTASKDKIRFAVCRVDGKHSVVWAAWGRGDDFYFGARSVLGAIKVSLHASGIGRIAFTD